MEEQEIFWNDYKIICDQHNRTLYKKMVVKKEGKNKGKVYWDLVGHFNPYRMDALLQKMLYLESLRHKHTFALEEYIALWARLYEKFTGDIKEKLETVSA